MPHGHPAAPHQPAPQHQPVTQPLQTTSQDVPFRSALGTESDQPLKLEALRQLIAEDAWREDLDLTDLFDTKQNGE